MSVTERLQSLNIEVPPMTAPVAAFVPYVRTGNLVYLSGHVAKMQGKPWVGQLGGELSTADGIKAARQVAIDLLGTLHAAAGGLDNVTKIVKLMILVNSRPDFTEQHLVANGASELFIQAFGHEIGSHCRSAFGVAQVPFGSCVEIDLVAELKG